MGIQHRGSGSYVNGTGNITPDIHGSTVQGDMMLCLVSTKPYNGVNTMPAGWVSIGSATDGTTAAGTDVGSMKTEVFWKIHDGSESNPLVTNTTNNVSGAVIHSYYKTSSAYGFLTPVGAGGGDASAGTGFSITAGSNPGITSGDMLVIVAGFRSESAVATSSQSLTATSATIAALTKAPGTDLTTTAGGDMGMTAAYALCTAGTASAAPVLAMTLAGSHTGSGFIVRLREELLPALYPRQIVANTADTDGTTSCVMGTCAANSRVQALVGHPNDITLVAGDASITSTPTLSWNKIVDNQGVSTGNNQIWEADYPDGGALTVNAAWGSERIALVVLVEEGTETTPGGATASNANQSAPSLNITTTRANSLVIGIVTDWAADGDGTTMAYRNSPVVASEAWFLSSFGNYVFFKIVEAVGTETFGMTLPSSQDSGVSLYEIRLPASGTTYDESMTSSITVDVTQSASQEHAVSVTETITPAVSQDATAEFNASLTETITPATSEVPALEMAASLEEAVTLDVDEAGGLDLSGTVEETITLSDQVDAVNTLNETLNSDITLDVDEQVTAEMGVTLEEALTLDASHEGANTMEASLTEQVTLAADHSGAAEFNVSLSEGITLSDLIEAGMIFDVILEESVTLDVQQSVNLVISLSLEETITLQDQLDATGEFNVGLTEEIILNVSQQSGNTTSIIKLKVDGSWRATTCWIKHEGVWKIANVFIKNNGNWQNY